MCPSEHELVYMSSPFHRRSDQSNLAGKSLFCNECGIKFKPSAGYYRCNDHSCDYDLCKHCATQPDTAYNRFCNCFCRSKAIKILLSFNPFRDLKFSKFSCVVFFVCAMISIYFEIYKNAFDTSSKLINLYTAICLAFWLLSSIYYFLSGT